MKAKKIWEEKAHVATFKVRYYLPERHSPRTPETCDEACYNVHACCSAVYLDEPFNCAVVHLFSDTNGPVELPEMEYKVFYVFTKQQATRAVLSLFENWKEKIKMHVPADDKRTDVQVKEDYLKTLEG